MNLEAIKKASSAMQGEDLQAKYHYEALIRRKGPEWIAQLLVENERLTEAIADLIGRYHHYRMRINTSSNAEITKQLAVLSSTDAASAILSDVLERLQAINQMRR